MSQAKRPNKSSIVYDRSESPISSPREAITSQSRKKFKVGGISLGEELLQDSVYSGPSVLDWVQKSRTLGEKEKEAAELRKARKQFEEEENEILNSKLKKISYDDMGNNADLAGKKVMHDANQFQSGETKILTLKDRPILDDRLNIIEDEDELINVELLEKDRLALKKNKNEKNTRV